MNTKKYTVITGASSGIGYEVAKAFAGREKNLIIVARRKEQLEKLSDEVLTDNPELDIIVKVADLSKTEEVYQLYADLKQYEIETWINNAGFGFDGLVLEQQESSISEMIHLNVEATTLLSTFFAKDYKNKEGIQLINVASVVGYFLIPTAVAYSATKFFITAFTEGLDRELQTKNSKMRAKILAPAATQTSFASVATGTEAFDYDKGFERYHTAAQMAEFLIKLYDSDKTVGIVDMYSFDFQLKEPIHNYRK